MNPSENGAPDRIDSRHPWRSPYGRLAMLDVQIGNPADLSNLSACRAENRIQMPEHENTKGRYSDLVSFGAPDRIRTCGPQIRNLVLYPTELRAL